MEHKVCNMCNTSYPNTSDFFSPRYYTLKSGERKTALLSGCRTCYLKYHTENHTKKFQEGDVWLAACEIVNRMKDRTKKEGYLEPVEWTAKAVEERILPGLCEVTKYPFRFGTSKRGPKHKNPFSPSPDRVDPSVGYTLDNTRFVVFIYNAMRNNFDEVDVLAFINHIKKD